MRDNPENPCEFLRRVIDQFGAGMSVGALYAMVITLEKLRTGHRPTVGEISRLSGVPRQTVSRWLSHHFEKGWIEFEGNPDDCRERLISAEPELLTSMLNRIDELLAIESTNPSGE